jgi:carboxymethylenebutenolidase
METRELAFGTKNGDTTAFVVIPDEGISGKAVVLIHEWWGLNDHIKDVAQRYAEEGFTVIAPDLYRGKVYTTPEDAGVAMNALALEDGVDTISCAIQAAKKELAVSTFGISGFCMGGTFALRAACDLDELNAAAPFYGDIPDESVLANLTVPTVFISGTKDAWITADKVDELEGTATKLGLPVKCVRYESDHAFFNDTRPDVYDEKSARDAWRLVTGFFSDNL